MRDNLPIRKKIRLDDYDYSKEGMYFITFCVQNRLNLLGKINNNKIILTKEGKIAAYYIDEMENIFQNITIDECTIMPNHIHVIIIIHKKTNDTISKMIKYYKTIVTRKIGYSIWQRSFHEHIIRNKAEYHIIKKYIKNNVFNWKDDMYF